MNNPKFQKGYSLVVADLNETGGFLKDIAHAGFDGIEPTFVADAYPSPSDYANRSRELKMICDGLGLGIPSMRGGLVPWDTIPSSSPHRRAEALAHTRKAMECLAIMGGSVLLVVPGRRTPDVDYNTHWNRVVEYANAAGEIAGEYGMRIGFENVEARFPVSELDWVALIDEIDSPHIGIYLDVGNVLWMGFGYPEHWIMTLAHRIIQVHFKDAVYRLNGGTLHSEIRQLLDGDVNWPAVMKALDDVSYHGWISVEPVSYRHLPELLPRRLSSDLDILFSINGGGR